MNHRKKAEILKSINEVNSLEKHLQRSGVSALGVTDKQNVKKSGTSILMFCYEKGILCAADRQESYGSGSINSQEILKIEPIGRAAAILGSGSVRSIQMIVKAIRSVCESFQIKTGYRMTTAGLANRLGELCSAMTFIWGEDYFSVGILLAGVDEDGKFEMYEIDSDGCVAQNEKYLCSGSGGKFIKPILNKDWKEDLTIEQSISLAVDCLYGSGRIDAWSSPLPQVPPFMVTITADKLFDLAPQKMIDAYVGRLILERPELNYLIRCLAVAKV